MTDEHERLRKLLHEDAASEEDVEALLEPLLRLKHLPTPRPETPQLVEHLLPGLRQPSRRERLTSWWPWLLLRAQLQIVRREIWAASALVIALGTFVAIVLGRSESGALPFILVAPLVAAVGIAFLYGPDSATMIELEATMPTSPRLVLLVRLALVFGFNLGLGLIASAFLALVHRDLSLWPLIGSWLAPMAFLSTLAFLVSVLFRDSLGGALAALALWALQSMRTLFQSELASAAPVFRLPDLLAAEARPWLLLLALLFGLLALWLAGRTNRSMGEMTS